MRGGAGEQVYLSYLNIVHWQARLLTHTMVIDSEPDKCFTVWNLAPQNLAKTELSCSCSGKCLGRLFIVVDLLTEKVLQVELVCII